MMYILYCTVTNQATANYLSNVANKMATINQPNVYTQSISAIILVQ